MTRIIESEKTLEARLRTQVQARGGMCLKILSQHHRGLPDRLVLMPGGRPHFVELKSTGKHPEPLQVHAMEQLGDLGFHSHVIDSSESLRLFLQRIDKEQRQNGQ